MKPAVQKIYFVNRFYTPDSSATSLLLADLTQGLATNFDIEVVTSRSSMNGDLRLPVRDSVAGVPVHRLASSRFGKANLWRKALDLLSFHFAVAWFLLGNLKKHDLVVLKTDPPLMQLFNTSIVHLKRGRVVNWLQDIYPEIAVRLGKFPGPQWLSDVLESWRDKALNKAVANVVISEDMAKYLNSRLNKPVTIIPNWADETLISPVPRDQNPLRAEWDLKEKFVVMYSGNFGRVHEFEEICQAVELLDTAPNICFVFIGNGHYQPRIKNRFEKRKLKNVMFKPFQPLEALKQSLGLADLHLVSLKSGMEQLVMPSKIYGALAAGRAIGFIGEADSNIGQQLVERSAGFSVALGSGEELAQHIVQLAADPDRCGEMGRNACQWFLSSYSKADGIERWKKLLLPLLNKEYETS